MTRIEEWVRQEKFGRLELGPLGDGQDTQVSDQLCRSASDMANSLGAAAIFVYTRRGYMARFLSRYRPDCPVRARTLSLSMCDLYTLDMYMHVTLTRLCFTMNMHTDFRLHPRVVGPSPPQRVLGGHAV